GRYAPASSAGRRLLAHELAHVVQQHKAQSRSPAAAAGDAIGARLRPVSSAVIQRQSGAQVLRIVAPVVVEGLDAAAQAFLVEVSTAALAALAATFATPIGVVILVVGVGLYAYASMPHPTAPAPERRLPPTMNVPSRPRVVPLPTPRSFRLADL